MHLVDLAGSERTHRAKTDGERVKEASKCGRRSATGHIERVRCRQATSIRR
jgi:hypothetical protein